MLRDQELTVTEIQEMLGLPQANLSQHLQVLRESGVVKAKKNGKQVYYQLAHKNFVKASDLMRQVLVERYKGTKLEDEFTMKMTDLVPLVQDPVCGMRLSPKTASYAYQFNGREHYFCAGGCYEKFKKQLSRYFKGGKE